MEQDVIKVASCNAHMDWLLSPSNHYSC